MHLHKVFVPNKIEHLNLSVFNMVTGKNESTNLTKDLPCECKCKFFETKCNSNGEIAIIVDVSVKTWYIWKRFYFEFCHMKLQKW